MFYSTVELVTKSQKEEYRDLIERVGLTYEETELALGVYNGDEIIAGVSLDKNCIKLLRVSCNYNGDGISDVLISDIIKYAYDRGVHHLFVYTKPSNEEIFTKQGFYTIFKTDDVLFLENTRNGISRYVKQLESKKVDGKNIASIVMNLNPITLGHEHLIKCASEENDVVHIFLVKEDKSVFPYEVRLKLLEEVAKRYSNVIVHKGSDYIISNATFPTYFLKSKDNVPTIYATLDINIFAKYIANTLGINKRYIGTEPYSKTTNMYNEVMKEILPNYNIDVVEIERKGVEDSFISASKVRQFIKDDNIHEAFKYLPNETINFLKSDEAVDIIDKVKNNTNRH